MKFSTIFSVFLATLSVQQDYGFDHIGIIIGEVKEKALKKKTKRDFVAQFHHLVMNKERDTEYRHTNWETRKQKDGKAEPKLEFLTKINSAKKATSVTKKGNEYIKDHKKWEAKKTDCKTFVDYIHSTIA
ncbi:uncharacterized protein ACLA_004350 [Aspergillus clavatus NRRL 1]|uniref:Uncharacterized protein n=1 Tax=Aspergillus clavatus (strain ATCC 1007 / CBS 513.65 / DSM 816 / NCTC 3887 / NRRL 1 / QM 1276 / 107) TaxID=344612 RepID=A1C5Q3_ASPCL|nr:uncharacterized protein ACLA_004350 [Aspergillus clavatus NRRL 1]EAW15021.1 hypothetical protein ACLA_004350 [Aspergillus clavatus NRRL 1]